MDGEENDGIFLNISKKHIFLEDDKNSEDLQKDEVKDQVEWNKGDVEETDERQLDSNLWEDESNENEKDDISEEDDQKEGIFLNVLKFYNEIFRRRKKNR